MSGQRIPGTLCHWLRGSFFGNHQLFGCSYLPIKLFSQGVNYLLLEYKDLLGCWRDNKVTKKTDMLGCIWFSGISSSSYSRFICLVQLGNKESLKNVSPLYLFTCIAARHLYAEFGFSMQMVYGLPAGNSEILFCILIYSISEYKPSDSGCFLLMKLFVQFLVLLASSSMYISSL